MNRFLCRTLGCTSIFAHFFDWPYWLCVKSDLRDFKKREKQRAGSGGRNRGS